jgi:glycerate kinase
MRIVLAPDSFKESLSSIEVCNALKTGILQMRPEIEVIVAPIADGGEGTVDTLMTIDGAKLLSNTVTGPMGSMVSASWVILTNNDNTAVIEMASTAGLPLVPPDQRNPMKATTYGLGELILEAIKQGSKEILIGIGGSATNDGGAGMLQALKYNLLDEYGEQIPHGNEGLGRIRSIDDRHVDPNLKEITIVVASDVQNPLTGPNGSSFVYGPQKGASEEMVISMDENMKNFAQVVHAWKGLDFSSNQGAGAAGGLGFAFLAFLNSELRSGFEEIAELVGLESKIASADWVLTGEGKLDSQTLQGKGPFGVAQMAKRHGKPIIAVGGVIDPQAKESLEKEFSKIFKISPEKTSKEESILKAEKYLVETGKRIAKSVL